MTNGSLDFSFVPDRRLYSQLVGFPWFAEAWLKDDDGAPIDLTGWTLDSITKDGDGNIGSLTITRSTADPTRFFFGQDLTTVTLDWLVTMAAPGGPAIPQFYGSLNARVGP